MCCSTLSRSRAKWSIWPRPRRLATYRRPATWCAPPFAPFLMMHPGLSAERYAPDDPTGGLRAKDLREVRLLDKRARRDRHVHFNRGQGLGRPGKYPKGTYRSETAPTGLWKARRTSARSLCCQSLRLA
jgi:hypothetical protein